MRPVGRKRARALAAAFRRIPPGRTESAAFQEVVAEALGADNYALLTGDHVQEFDEFGFYVRTSLPGAVMVEPAEDLLRPAPDQRFRVVPGPWDGADLRADEVEELGLCAVLWQTAGGAAVLEYLSPKAGERRVPIRT